MAAPPPQQPAQPPQAPQPQPLPLHQAPAQVGASPSAAQVGSGQQQQQQPQQAGAASLQAGQAGAGLQVAAQAQDFDPVQRFRLLLPQLKESLQVRAGPAKGRGLGWPGFSRRWSSGTPLQGLKRAGSPQQPGLDLCWPGQPPGRRPPPPNPLQSPPLPPAAGSSMHVIHRHGPLFLE